MTNINSVLTTRKCRIAWKDVGISGVQPTVGQLDDIISVIYFLQADANEASEYMQMRMAIHKTEDNKEAE